MYLEMQPLWALLQEIPWHTGCWYVGLLKIAIHFKMSNFKLFF